MQIILTENAIWNEENLKFGSCIPTQATPGSAGYDIRACIRNTLEIPAGKTVMVPLGFKCSIADVKIAALILPRSGLGAKEGIVLGNLVGLIDSDYHEEWMCAVWNRNIRKTICIDPMMKLAQIIFVSVYSPAFELSEEFSATTTRTGGFGSTTKKESK
jgi:dUTP pyrophosphatase